MPTNRYPFNLLLKNKKDSKEEATLEKDQQTIDYGLKMINAIDIEFIDTNLYMSKELKQNFNNKGVFGGQIVAQALHAGWNTIADDFFVHVRFLFQDA
jgi:methanogenic corrinoid protein MtbC1